MCRPPMRWPSCGSAVATRMFASVLFCLLIPAQATAIPIYIMLYKAGLLNTYASLVLPFTISVFGIFLMRQFFLAVPDDLIDAARIDGMSEFAHRVARDGADRDAGAGRRSASSRSWRTGTIISGR